MNKAEFKAIKMIAEKLNWKSVNFETIKQMVRNQQALELDTVGECGSDGETLLSIALCDHDKIVSTMYVSSYQDLIMWNVQCFCDNMGITLEDFSAMLTWHSIKDSLLAAEYEAEESFALMAAEYNDADWMEFYDYRNNWIRNNCW